MSGQFRTLAMFFAMILFCWFIWSNKWIFDHTLGGCTVYNHCHLQEVFLLVFAGILFRLSLVHVRSTNKKRHHKFCKNLTTVFVLKFALSYNVKGFPLELFTVEGVTGKQARRQQFAAFSQVESHFGSPIRALKCQHHTANNHKSRHKVKLLTHRPSILLLKWVFKVKKLNGKLHSLLKT